MVDEIVALLRSGTCARDANGLACNLSNPDACKWCLWGAVNKVLRTPEQLSMAHRFLATKLGMTPGIWNDSCISVDEVIAFLLLTKEEFELCVSK